MDAVRRCAEHGFFGGQSCPACADQESVVLAGGRRERLSRFLSGALPHFTEDVGVELQPGRWTSLESVAAAAGDRFGWADRDAVVGVVQTDPEGRFEQTDWLVRGVPVTAST